MTAHWFAADDAEARAGWERLYAQHPAPTPFAALAVADAMREAVGLDFRLLFARGKERAQAGMIVFEKKRGPYRLAIVPPLLPFTPLLLAGPLRETDVHHRRSPLDVLLDALERRYHRLHLHLPPDLTDARPLSWRGWHVSPAYTYLLELGAPDALRSSWSGGTRRLFQQHEAAYQIAEGADLIPRAVALYGDSYRRQGRRFPVADARACALVTHLHRHGHATAYTATPTGGREPEAGLVVLRAGGSACYWMAGSVPGPAMTFLIGRVLPHLQADGVRSFDFVGANVPGIAEFKRHFGPKLVPCYRAHRTLRPDLRLLDALYHRLR